MMGKVEMFDVVQPVTILPVNMENNRYTSYPKLKVHFHLEVIAPVKNSAYRDQRLFCDERVHDADLDQNTTAQVNDDMRCPHLDFHETENRENQIGR